MRRRHDGLGRHHLDVFMQEQLIRFCFCKNNKRTIIKGIIIVLMADSQDSVYLRRTNKDSTLAALARRARAR